jgi:hypothetical protein
MVVFRYVCRSLYSLVFMIVVRCGRRRVLEVVGEKLAGQLSSGRVGRGRYCRCGRQRGCGGFLNIICGQNFGLPNGARCEKETGLS